MNSIALHEMKDRVVGERYRLDELVGVGAISAVFSAYDNVDERQVAVKLFDENLATDERFSERLLDAVEQASVLRHQNVVEIYDWGVDNGPYIVSELCEGGSLASLLQAGHTLAPSQALVLALECARALNFGHEQGAIHRDLTPRNVLFTDDQQVRLADYGLHKVIADAPVSQATRALENVRYASPEQARGRPVGESTDLYSLALVLNEAVSGQPPRVAETVVGTLMERAESPAELDAVLEGLLAPLERCGRVDPDERPEAEELTIALLAAAETMPRPNALPLVGLGLPDDSEPPTLRVSGGVPGPATATADVSERESGDIEAVDDLPAPNDDEHIVGNNSQKVSEGSVAESSPAVVDDSTDPDGHSDNPDADFETDDFDVSTLSELDDLDGFADEIVDADQTELQLQTDEPARGGLENLEQATPVFAEVPGVEPAEESELDVPEPVLTRRAATLAYEEDEDDADDRLPWWPLLFLGLLIAGAVGAAIYFFALDETAQAEQVPDLIGVQFDDIDELIGGRDWSIERLETRVDGSVVGSIVAQSPDAGGDLHAGETLTVTVSLGNAMVAIPSDIVGLTVEQAASRLSSVGLALGELTEEESEAFAAGLVVAIDEPTTQTPSGETVDLRVSAGPQDRVVPSNVIGMAIGDATSLLVGLRLQAVEEPAYSPDAEVGTVLASIPDAGEIVPADSAVTLIVSAGPEPVEMPDIVGLDLEQAIDVVEALGLIWIDTDGTPGEEVIGSLPPIGATVDVGTEVTIILADPPDDDG